MIILKKEGKANRDANKTRKRIRVNPERSPLKLVANCRNKLKDSIEINIENMTIKELEEYVNSL